MDEKDLKNVAKIPLAQPGMDAFGMTAPVLVQMNPHGKWENTKPQNLDEERLKAVVQHLINTKAVSAVQSYCTQCAAENKFPKGNEKSNYIPVIMMPIYSADQCPFDLDCEIQKMKETETKPVKKRILKEQEKQSEKDKDKKKLKKRAFVLQRLTDFDLLSQW